MSMVDEVRTLMLGEIKRALELRNYADVERLTIALSVLSGAANGHGIDTAHYDGPPTQGTTAAGDIPSGHA